MTRVEFFNPDGRINGFSVAGHSGYGEAGQDIVCASVTTAVKLAECIINDVCGTGAKTKVKEEDARITLQLPKVCDEEETVQSVLTGMMLTLGELRDEYPEFLEVLEV